MEVVKQWHCEWKINQGGVHREDWHVGPIDLDRAAEASLGSFGYHDDLLGETKPWLCYDSFTVAVGGGRGSSCR